MQHSKYAPSSAYRWINCSPSADAPDTGESGEEAELGVYIHAIVSGENPTPPREFTEDEISAAELCIKEWNKVIEQAAYEPGELHTEQRIIAGWFPDFGGTLDMLRVSEDTIHVYDLKTGMGPVSAEDNPQLASYLLLAKEKFPGRERFFGTIVQPRLGYVSTHEFTAAALSNFRALVEASPDRRDLSPGGHCEHCPLLGTCPAAFEEAHKILEESPRALPPIDPILPPEVARWKRLVEFAPVVEELETFGRKEMLQHIEAGETIPGWKAANQGARRVWRNQKHALATLEEIVDDPTVLTVTKIKSPAQMEKLGFIIPDELIYKPEGKVVLAKRSSPKSEIVDTDGSEFDESS